MSERLYQGFDVRPEDEKVVDSMFSIVERHVEPPNQGLDPVELALLQNLYNELLTNNFNWPSGRLRPHLEQVVATRRQRGSFFPAAYALRVLEFAVDKQLRARIPEYYPKYFDRQGAWQTSDVFGSLIDINELFEDMAFHDLQTSRPSAYAVYHILSQLAPGIETVLDNGVSAAHGPKRWLMEGERPFDLRVVKKPRLGPIVPGDMETDEEAQARVDELRHNPPVVKRLVGYDAQPVHLEDGDTMRRVRSQTLPFGEPENRPDEAADFDRLAKASTDRVKVAREFIPATDEAALNILRDPRYLPDGKADMGIMSAFLFSNSPDEVSGIMRNQSDLYRPGAKLFVADFARSNPSVPFGLEFIRRDWWTGPGGAFSLFMLDPHELDKPAVKLGTFTNRYGNEIMLSGAGRRVILSGDLNAG